MYIFCTDETRLLDYKLNLYTIIQNLRLQKMKITYIIRKKIFLDAESVKQFYIFNVVIKQNIWLIY